MAKLKNDVSRWTFYCLYSQRRGGRIALAVTMAAATAVLVLIVCFILWEPSETGPAGDVQRATETPPTSNDASQSRPLASDGRTHVTLSGAARVNENQLSSIPGFDSSLLGLSLSKVAEKVDASRDVWEAERFHDQAAKQLSALSALLSRPGEAVPNDVRGVVTDDFACGPLRPVRLQRIYSDQALEVFRPSASDGAPDTTLAYRGANGLIDAIALLCTTRAGTEPATVKLKVYRVNLNETKAHTTVEFQSQRRTLHGVIQQNATWQCEWSAPNSESDPLLQTVRVEDYEEIIPRGDSPQLLADCTAAVLGKDPSFQQQLVYGIDHWRRMLERSLDPDLSGFQGISVGDVNGDDLEDVYICQQGGLPNRLFVQQRDGTLQDTSASAAVDLLDLTSSALIIDLDNDGDQDLVLATVSAVVFFSNDGSGAFTRRLVVDAHAALQSLSASDYDGDGDLDVYACGYTAGDQVWKSEAGLGAPVPYYDADNGGTNLLLRNDGDFRFVDATAATGLDVNNRRFSFAATWEDYDNDGDPDLYVANDFGRNNLYRNDGGRFVDVAGLAGVEDMATGMSADWGDYDNDGWMDLYVGNMFSTAGGRVAYQRKFLPEAADKMRDSVRRFSRGNSLFRNRGDGTFFDVSESAAVTKGRWAWASKFVDLNSDGWEDLVVANGFITHHDTGDL